MNRHEKRAQQPGNRPSGIPGNARFAGAGVMSGIMFIVIALCADYSVYTNRSADYFGVFTLLFIPLVIVSVAIAWLLNTGKLAFVKLFGKLAIIVSTAYVGTILLSIFQVLYYKWDRPVMAAIGIIILVVFSPMQFLMWRDFRRCRWLDPRSLPGEWEIAAIRDPNSINYRPPKPQRRN
ncbi:MAG TPA: hypothetical protein VFG62_19920 [Rhodopila sp.]|jgi:hypothetical protein|nr:hypothetical protein [Rhodopila sp.]